MPLAPYTRSVRHPHLSPFARAVPESQPHSCSDQIPDDAGAINLENNKKVTAEITQLLAEFDVPPNKMYINFFDVPRENCGYNGATFAG